MGKWLRIVKRCIENTDKAFQYILMPNYVELSMAQNIIKMIQKISGEISVYSSRALLWKSLPICSHLSKTFGAVWNEI